MKTIPCAVCKTPVPFYGPIIGRQTVFCTKHVREGLSILPDLFKRAGRRCNAKLCDGAEENA